MSNGAPARALPRTVRNPSPEEKKAIEALWENDDPSPDGPSHRIEDLAVSLWQLGYPDQALKINREMRQLAREIGHPFSMAYALHHTGWLYQYCRLGPEVGMG